MSALRQHYYLAALFVCLSVADLALTSYLLRRPAGEVYEANWLAQEVLASWGLAGLAAFKGLVVLVAGGLLMVVATYRPRAARRLITFACAAVGSVVLYSLGLLFHLEQSAGAERGQDLATVTRVKQNLEQFHRKSARFSQLLGSATEALAAGHCTLREAVARLAGSDQGSNRTMITRYREILSATSDTECLAALATHGALVRLAEERSAAARDRADALLAAYRADHGTGLMPYLLEGVARRQHPDWGMDPPAVARAKVGPRPPLDLRRPPHGGPRPGSGWRPPRRPMAFGEFRLHPPLRPNA